MQLCYDALDRIERKHLEATDFTGSFVSCTQTPTTRFYYDEDYFGLGRLSSVDDPSGGTFFTYDARGRTTYTSKFIIDPDTSVHSADFVYDYDYSDHIESIRYPDGELVGHLYNEVGQIEGLQSDDGTWYLQGMTYDILGRPTEVGHGNGVFDARAFGTASESFRLQWLGSLNQEALLLSYTFEDYTPTGLLESLIDDNGGWGAYPSHLSAQASYTYDGLGRLQAANYPHLGQSYTYQYDMLGNLREKEGADLIYDTSSKPHQVLSFASGLVTHDDNGNRVNRPGVYDNAYVYDREDRLIEVATADETVSFDYDYSGARVRKTTTAMSEHYFGALAETRGEGSGLLVKHYFAGGMRIATRQVSPWTAAEALGPASGTTMLAWLREAFDAEQAGQASALAIGIGFVAIFSVPGRRRAVAGIVLRRGHLLGVAVVFFIGSVPWAHGGGLFVAKAALAGGGGGGPGGGPYAIDEVYHYHFDHLGSTHLVTDDAGDVIQHIRYKPFGEIRGQWDGVGGAQSASYRYEFTGYETEMYSGLQYAGARFYDPQMAMFLTHDPAREFPSPYTYVHWDPVNATDPTGACEAICLIAIGVGIGAAVGTTAAAVNAIVNGATWEKTLKAGAIGGAIGAASAFVGATVVGPALSGITAQLAADVGSSLANLIVYGTVYGASAAQAGYGISQGDYAGIIGLGLSIGISAAFWYAGSSSGGSSTALENGGTCRSCAMPQDIPPGVSVDRNIDAVWEQILQNPNDLEKVSQWWTNKVKAGGDWDYKLLKPEYENFGNFNYGATGRPLFDLETLQRAAGFIQWMNGPYDPNHGLPWGSAPFGDQPTDHFWIEQGARYYERSYTGVGVI